MVGQRLMVSAAVATFVPAELCPDHFVAAGKLTQAELLARDLGHGRLLWLLSTRGQPGWTGQAGCPFMRHQGKGCNSAGLASIQKRRI